MPLKPAGRKAKAAMKKEYGAKQGERIFYAKQNKSPSFKKATEKSSARRGRKR